MSIKNPLSEHIFAQSRASLVSKLFFLSTLAVVIGMGLAHFFYTSPVGSAQTQEESTEVVAEQSTFGIGEPITITWSVPEGADTTKDWIGIYHSTEGRMDEFVAWSYTDGSLAGSMDFSLTSEGDYVARYFKNDTFTVVALSPVFSVSASAGGGYTLTVPTGDFGVGVPIQISWTTPESADNTDDWIGLYVASEPREDEFVDWEYTDAASSGTLSLTSFGTGTYVAKYYKNDSFTKVAETVTFEIVAGGGGGTVGGYTLVSDTTTYGPGAPIEVTWSTPTEADNTKDWVGLYRSTETRMDEFYAWEYTGDSGSGSVTLSLPSEGEYVARYFKNDTMNAVAVTPTFSVVAGAAGGYSVTLPTSEYGLGEPLPVSFETPSGIGNAKDWIGVYHSTEGRNDNFIDWSYTDGSDTGTVSLTVFSEGTFVVRYFTDDSLNKVAQSDAFIISATGGGGGAYSVASSQTDYGLGAPVVITWDAPATANNVEDWIGIFPSTETRMDEYTAWDYTDETATGSLSFTVNAEGTYVARYFKNDSFTSVAVSAPFTITAGGSGGYTVSLPATEYGIGEPLPVSWTGPEGANNTKDWIGVYLATEPRSENFADWSYTDETNSGTVILNAFKEGTYVVRYYKNDGSTMVAQSDTFSIAAGASGGGGGYTIIVN